MQAVYLSPGVYQAVCGGGMAALKSTYSVCICVCSRIGVTAWLVCKHCVGNSVKSDRDRLNLNQISMQAN